jgi:hypothetical protein
LCVASKCRASPSQRQFLETPCNLYFCIFEGEFESEAALMSALASKEGQAVAGDVPNYASGGVTMLHFAVK